MNILDLETMQGQYRTSLNNLQNSITVAKMHNDQINNLTEQLRAISALDAKLNAYAQQLSLVRAACIQTEHNYQTRRINYLNTLITDALREVFPDENFEAKIIYEYGRKDTVRLELQDSAGHVSSPDIGQGQLMQYIISLVAVVGITSGLGFKNLFIDEAFGVAASSKLEDLGEILNRYAQNGMQIILVSQNPFLYNGIPHRVFTLNHDAVTKTTTVAKTEDF